MKSPSQFYLDLSKLNLLILQAQRKAKDLNLGNIELLVADAETIEIEEESFDTILCSSAMIYLQHHESALRRMYTWLKPGGKLCFNTPQVICCSTGKLPARVYLDRRHTICTCDLKLRQIPQQTTDK